MVGSGSLDAHGRPLGGFNPPPQPAVAKFDKYEALFSSGRAVQYSTVQIAGESIISCMGSVTLFVVFHGNAVRFLWQARRHPTESLVGVLGVQGL